MGSTDYSKGDYSTVADRLRPAAVALVAWCSPSPDELLLDIAAGTGNVAVESAKRRARVLAVDSTVQQLVNGRTANADPRIHWIAADAHQLPVRDGSADRALSTFGLIYAARPADAVREIGRVCRTGGFVAMTAWPEDGFQAVARLALAEATGGSVAADHVDTWGTSDRIETLLGLVADDIEVGTAQLESSFPSVDAWWESVSGSAPPIVTARERMPSGAFEELGAHLRDAATSMGRTEAEAFVLVDSYLLARGRLR